MWKFKNFVAFVKRLSNFVDLHGLSGFVELEVVHGRSRNFTEFVEFAEIPEFRADLSFEVLGVKPTQFGFLRSSTKSHEIPQHPTKFTKFGLVAMGSTDSKTCDRAIRNIDITPVEKLLPAKMSSFMPIGVVMR